MSITANSDFRGEILISNKSDVSVSENITWFINKYEPVYLRELLGSEFATLFVAGLSEDPVDERWTNLRTPNGYDLKTGIANFIYYWYQRDQDSQTVGVGTVQSKAQNATIVSAANKVVRAWFEMMTISWQVLRYLNDNADTYPEFVMPAWFNTFYCSWTCYNYSTDIFYSDFYSGFYRFYKIPDIFISINVMGL